MSEQPVLCKFKSLIVLRIVKRGLIRSQPAKPHRVAAPARDAKTSKVAEADAALT
jgi:hypothetical protein